MCRKEEGILPDIRQSYSIHRECAAYEEAEIENVGLKTKNASKICNLPKTAIEKWLKN